MPSSVARRMLIRSIVSWDTTTIRYPSARRLISPKAFSRAAGVMRLESSKGMSPGHSRGKITAATTTGPAKGPRPASSTPATRRNPSAQRACSSEKSAGARFGSRRLRMHLLFEPRLLAFQLAQEVQPAAAHAPLPHHFDALDARGMQGERPLHPEALGHLAHGERGVQRAFAVVVLDDGAFERLDAFLLAFEDAVIDPHHGTDRWLRAVCYQPRLLHPLQQGLLHGLLLRFLLATVSVTPDRPAKSVLNSPPLFQTYLGRSSCALAASGIGPVRHVRRC